MVPWVVLNRVQSFWRLLRQATVQFLTFATLISTEWLQTQEQAFGLNDIYLLAARKLDHDSKDQSTRHCNLYEKKGQGY